MHAQFQNEGFAIVPAVLDSDTILRIVEAVEKPLPVAAPGVRAIANKISAVAQLARSQMVRTLVEPVLGSSARLVRSILFNKSEDANWRVGWHQDLSIAIQHRMEIEGFGPWSIKEGIQHVQPPLEILESMLSIRLHLDNADESNGALWVSPGSHRLGRLPANMAAAVAARRGKYLCQAHAGDALLFRPLLLHSSQKATSKRPRRVIHFEFSDAPLPTPLLWAEASE